ncbi:hypothetical protein DFH09DRAFT_1112608 [Mycena vulgaris]|nr:hypothetical protein DFH09DRAFT_1112608 [Mycena vulgaris]
MWIHEHLPLHARRTTLTPDLVVRSATWPGREYKRPDIREDTGTTLGHSETSSPSRCTLVKPGHPSRIHSSDPEHRRPSLTKLGLNLLTFKDINDLESLFQTLGPNVNTICIRFIHVHDPSIPASASALSPRPCAPASNSRIVRPPRPRDPEAGNYPAGDLDADLDLALFPAIVHLYVAPTTPAQLPRLLPHLSSLKSIQTLNIGMHGFDGALGPDGVEALLPRFDAGLSALALPALKRVTIGLCNTKADSLVEDWSWCPSLTAAGKRELVAELLPVLELRECCMLHRRIVISLAAHVFALTLLTLPHLRRLELEADLDLRVLTSFLSCSRCVLKRVVIGGDDFKKEAQILKCLTVFSSVESLKIRHRLHGAPHLSAERERGLRALEHRMHSIEGAKLQSFHLSLARHSDSDGFDSEEEDSQLEYLWRPSGKAAAGLQCHIEDGLDFEMKLRSDGGDQYWPTNDTKGAALSLSLT